MKGILFVLLFSLNTVIAQKVIRKTVLNPNIRAIEIDAENCFEIDLKTVKSEEVLVQATIDGEYKKDLILIINEDEANLVLSAGFGPNFENPNDKLSAHKVISIALEISVPKSQRVQINGSGCNVFATGDFEKLKITLGDGSCTLRNISKKVSVLTHSGDINVESKKAQIHAVSKFGKITRNNIPSGENSYSLTTTTGDIDLIKID